MAHGAAQPGIGDLLWPALNFALFVAVLVRYGGGPLREFFRARTERLRAALAAGARARGEAQSLRARLAQDVAGLPALLERLRADLRATAEQERTTLLDLGRQAGERIREDARLLAAQELASARDALRAEVVEETAREAAALVRAAIRSDDQERLVREFVSTARAAS